MTVESTLAFALAVLLFAATPGPAILACIGQALGAGFRSALWLAGGIVLGDLLFFLVAVYGLALLATLLDGLFLAVRLAGSGYLMWIGWKMWTEAGRSAVEAGSGAHGNRKAFQAGLLLTLGNPKVIMFYLGFMPAFMDLTNLGWHDVATAASVLMVVLMAVNASYALMASRARGLVSSPRATGLLNRGAGAIMIGLGGYLAASGVSSSPTESAVRIR